MGHFISEDLDVTWFQSTLKSENKYSSCLGVTTMKALGLMQSVGLTSVSSNTGNLLLAVLANLSI